MAKTITVEVTAEDIEQGLEDCIAQGDWPVWCALARALRRTHPRARVLKYSWHEAPDKEHPGARPGVKLPAPAIALVKALDEKLTDETTARIVEASGATARRRVDMPKPVTLTLPVPA